MPALPLVRDCRPGGLRPLLAPGGRDTYFSPDVQRMVFPPDEALARFLPPATWILPDRANRAADTGPQVAYTIPDEILKTASPLTTLSRAEIDAFAAAVAAFLAKARPDAQDVPPFVRQCRQEFRLPDPEIDHIAYWVYGPEFDRRLLVLWGCEPHAGSSLPLEKAIARLRDREMTWPDKQALALKLARRLDSPLARFLAPRNADGDLVVAGAAAPPPKLTTRRPIPTSPESRPSSRRSVRSSACPRPPRCPAIFTSSAPSSSSRSTLGRARRRSHWSRTRSSSFPRLPLP